MISRGSKRSRAVLVLAVYLGLAAAGVLWAWLRGQANVWRSGNIAEPRFWAGLAGGVGLGLLIVLLSRLAVHRFEWARALHREFRTLVGPLTDLEIGVLAAVSSLGEEVFFRGALMPVVGVWISSVVFALLHVGPRLRHLPWTFGSFVAGLLFSQLFLWSGDLTGPVLAHFTVNFLNLRHIAHDERR